MKHGATTCWAVAAAAVLLAGCNETAMNHAQAHQPAPAPAPAFVQAQSPKPLPESLPLSSRPVYFSLLQPQPRPAIDVLIDRAHANLVAAEASYQAGDLDKARDLFDRAEQLILSSGIPEDADPRISNLLDQIADASQGYEVEADKANQQEEAETPSTPAPIDELNDLTLPPGDPRLALKAEKELFAAPHDLPLTVNDSVLQYLSFFTTTRGRAIVERGLGRAGRYDQMIRRVLREEGVPQDLIYLAQAESAFLPQAVSRAGARGIWQFMPFRGEEYDLTRTYYIDERSDPEKSTRAAAHHLKDLYDMFGDWYLVMAAYNSGPLNVIKAIERTGYADFWELQKRNVLPKQTRNYVPIIIALALVAKAPAMYGVQVSPEKPEPLDHVKPGRAVDLRLVADASGADLDDLHLLNPQLIRNVTPNDPGFELNLPRGSAEKFEENIQQVPEEKWTSWRLHAVAQGESLADIARHYRVTVASIETANHLQARAVIPAGFLLNVPTAPAVVRMTSYRVQRGDTLEGIADRFDVSVAQLKRWNRISGNRVSRGMRLRIYAGGNEPGAASASRTKPKTVATSAASTKPVSSLSHDPSEAVQHRVKPGETLYQIAHAYRTTVAALRQGNPFLSDRPLEAGDLLVIQR
jgi:membrane-bound lytic murein transglycosylase D